MLVQIYGFGSHCKPGFLELQLGGIRRHLNELVKQALCHSFVIVCSLVGGASRELTTSTRLVH